MLRARLYVLCIVLLACVPGALTMAFGGPPWRAFWIEGSIALGYVGLGLFAVQFATTGRFDRVAGPLGTDGLLRTHRNLGIAAACMVLVHPVLLLALEPSYRAFLDPRENLLRALVLTAVPFVLAAIVVLPLVKRRWNIDYGWWRLTHGALALALVGIGTAHVLYVQHHTSSLWKAALWVSMGLAAGGALVWVRIVRPLRLYRQPWRVSAVEKVADRTWSLTLDAEEQAGNGVHGGCTFRPGQFAWLTIAASPFDLEQHPFSFASSATQPNRVSFAIKELGDFTRAIGATPIGARAFVDAAYGSLVLPMTWRGPVVLLAGGIGIAPFLSMVRTFAERGEQRELLLVYGASRPEMLAFARELKELVERIGARVVLVVEEPPEGWAEETGFIDSDLLDRVVPADWFARGYFLACGPGPMLASLGDDLLQRGVPHGRYNAEHFDLG